MAREDYGEAQCRKFEKYVAKVSVVKEKTYRLESMILSLIAKMAPPKERQEEGESVDRM